MSPSGHLQQLQIPILSMYLPMQVFFVKPEKVVFLQKTKYIDTLPELTAFWVFVLPGKVQTLIQMTQEIICTT